MINVTKTYLPSLERYNKYVQEIFESGWLTNNGRLVQKFQKELADYLGVNHLLLVSNGTIALQIAYKVLGLKGQVMTTPFSFVATTSSLVWAGLEPVFADISPLYLNIDPTEVEKRMTPDISAIVATHVFGNACEVEHLQFIADKNNSSLIYDAAHAFAVGYRGESLMNYGDISMMSFHSTKVFHSIEGGALIFKSKDLYEKAKNMINFGIISPLEVVDLGINGKMNEFQAAMGLSMLQEMDEIFSSREKRYQFYFEELVDNPRIQLPTRNEHCNNNYSYFPILFRDEETLLRAEQQLQEREIYPRRYFYPSLNTLPYLSTKPSMPISENVSRRILCLPLFHDLERATQQIIIDIIRESVQS